MMKIAMNAAMTLTSLRTLYGLAGDETLVASVMLLFLRFARNGYSLSGRVQFFRREKGKGWI